MAEVVDNSLRFLSRNDIGAMATYLKSVPSIGDSGNVAAAETPSQQGESTEEIPLDSSRDPLGLRVFEGDCVGCHDFNGTGAVSNYASLTGDRSLPF
jgi:cytochrome c